MEQALSREETRSPPWVAVDMNGAACLFGLRRRCPSHDRPQGVWRDRGHWRFALGRLVSNFAARPDKIIGAAGGRRKRFALDQRSGGKSIDRGRARARAA